MRRISQALQFGSGPLEGKCHLRSDSASNGSHHNLARKKFPLQGASSKHMSALHTGGAARWPAREKEVSGFGATLQATDVFLHVRDFICNTFIVELSCMALDFGIVVLWERDQGFHRFSPRF